MSTQPSVRGQRVRVQRYLKFLLANAVVCCACVSQADIEPFISITVSPAAPSGVISDTTLLTSFTTSQGVVTSLSHAISGQGRFDIPTAALPNEVRNVWGESGAEIDGADAVLNLDIAHGVLNGGDSNATTFVDVGATGKSEMQYFFSQQIDAGAAGNANDFFLMELDGNDAVTIVPLDAGGNTIGTYSMSLTGANWGDVAPGLMRIGDNLGAAANPSGLAGVAFDLEDFDNGTSTVVSGVHGIGISGTTGLDAVVIGVHSDLAPVVSAPAANPQIHVDRLTGEISLVNTGNADLEFRGYSILSTEGALVYDNWVTIAGNLDLAGNMTIDSDDNWTQLSAVGSTTDLSEFEFGGDGGTLGAGQSIVLSQGTGGWLPWYNEGDLQAEVMLTDAVVPLTSVPVVYQGNGDTPLARSDFNHDGNVDETDWAILRDNGLTNLGGLNLVQAYVKGDVDLNGSNGIADFNLFISDFDGANGPGAFNAMLAGTPVPEPATAGLLGLLAGLAFAGRSFRNTTLATTSSMRSSVATLGVSIAFLVGLSVTDTVDAASPYAPDAQTTHLYHLDESVLSTVATNLGTAGNSAIAFDGSTIASPAPIETSILGATGLAGFGTAANLLDTNHGLGFDGNGDGFLQRDPTSQDDFITNSSLTGADGAFTVEALINLDGGLVIDAEREIMSMDDAAGSRSFYFRVSNVGDVGTVRFRSISDGPAVDALIPTSGTHEYESGSWFHVAFAYDGAGEGEFFWTKMDSGASIANSLGTVAYSDITPTFDGPLVFGNEGREASSNSLQGSLDEVRISSVAREADEFIFNDDQVAFTAFVNLSTGEVELKNTTALDITFNSYELTSQTDETLLPGGWTTIGSQFGTHPRVLEVDGDDPGSTAGDGDGEAWSVVGGSGTEAMAEQFLLGDATLGAGESISLGNIYDTNVGGGLDILYRDAANGVVLPGLVEFFTPSTLQGDFNGDGTVNLADYTVWRDNLGSGDESSLNGNGNGLGGVDTADYALWKSNFGATSGALAGIATNVPEPKSVAIVGFACLFLAIATVARKGAFQSAKAMLVPAAMIVIGLSLSSVATAAFTIDRDYPIGSSEPGVSSGAPVSDVFDELTPFEDLVASGGPTYYQLTATDLSEGHPGSAGDFAIAFDGVDDFLSVPAPYNQIASGVSQGVQMWVYPQSTGTRQSILSDTRNAGGPAIAASGLWSQTNAAVTNDISILPTVPVVTGEWTHVAQHIFLNADTASPTTVPGSGSTRSLTSVVYINGVAVSANNTNSVTVAGTDFVVGATGSAAEASDFFHGRVDLIEVYQSAPNEFNLLVDNAYIASQTSQLPGGSLVMGDITLDGIVNDSDVDAFVAGWQSTKVLDGASNLLYVGDWSTWGLGDLNTDGRVNMSDALLLHEALLPQGGLNFDLLVGGRSNVPEPSTIASLILAIGFGCLARSSSSRS